MDICMDIHAKICGYGYGYGWEISYPRQAWKSPKIFRDFWQLSTLIANICGTDQQIENRNSSWKSTAPPTLDEKKLVYFGDYTVSQKKLCQPIFCSSSVKYEPISIKNGRIVPEETLNKTVPKMPTSPKVCACTTSGKSKCQIEQTTQ